MLDHHEGAPWPRFDDAVDEHHVPARRPWSITVRIAVFLGLDADNDAAARFAHLLIGALL